MEAQSQGVSYQKTLTLGRQNMFAEPTELGDLIRDHGLWPVGMSEDEFRRRIGSWVYAEEFLRILGASKTDSLDISDFEGATILHDLDRDIPEKWYETFDCVIDGGLLEHVFNFPTAIRSCMQMTRQGGHFVLSIVANNFFGHGFYQFSPELFFRMFSPENGFELVRMLAQENTIYQTTALGLPFLAEYAGPRYEVVDPARLGERVELTTRRSTVLFILAKRKEIVPIFRTFPKQSDYTVRWEASGTEQRPPGTHQPP
jgi:SAM-dependent methyltransferase